MQLSDEELRVLYKSVILPTASSTPPHPDPLGYLARAVLLSGGDPDYIDVEGNVGFMPVNPDTVFSETGGGDLTSLQGNVINTLAMDIQLFSRLGSVEGMIIAFHEGEEAAIDRNNISPEMKWLLESLPKARLDLQRILFPRKATVRDVVLFMKDMMNQDSLPKYQLDFFKELVQLDDR